jgi:hypothetical protein
MKKFAAACQEIKQCWLLATLHFPDSYILLQRLEACLSSTQLSIDRWAAIECDNKIKMTNVSQHRDAFSGIP